MVGAPQFDFYRDPSYLWPEDTWRRAVGLPPGRPVILYGGGYQTIVPPEPIYLAHLDAAIERGEIAGNPVVLFRRHPVEPVERWQGVVAAARHVVSDEPWAPGREVAGKTNVRRADIERLASTLHHADVHVNVSSTMTVDGAFFDRPQVGPAYDDTPGARHHRTVRELYEREHYVPITRSGGLALAGSRQALAAAVNAALAAPGEGTEGRRRIVREIATYADGRSTDRVYDALAHFLTGATPSAAAPRAVAAGVA